jgi:hypothetical protein
MANIKSLFYLCIALCMLLACGGAWGMKKGSKTDVNFKFDLQPEEEDKVSPNALINSMPVYPTKVRFVNSLVKTFKKMKEFYLDMQSFGEIMSKSRKLTKCDYPCFVECVNQDERHENQKNKKEGYKIRPFEEPEQCIEEEIKKIENIKNNEAIEIKKCDTTITQFQEERKLLDRIKNVDYGKEIRNSAVFTVTMFAVSLGGFLFKSNWQLPRSIFLTASILSGVTGLAFLWHYIKKQGLFKQREKIDDGLKRAQRKIKEINNETEKQLSQHLSMDDLKTIKNILSKKKREEFNTFWTNFRQSFIPTDKTALNELCKKLKSEDFAFFCHLSLLICNLESYIREKTNLMSGDWYHYPLSWGFTVKYQQESNINTVLREVSKIFEDAVTKLNPPFDYKKLPKLSPEDQDLFKPLNSLYEW